MPLDFATLDALRSHHPAWRLLRSDHAALVASFLHRVFVTPNVRGMPAADLAEALEDELYALRLTCGEDAFPKAAIDYLDDWAARVRQLRSQVLVFARAHFQKCHYNSASCSGAAGVSIPNA